MPGALKKTYDGIIIGAGHHGLILGSYLAKAGLNVLLVDRRLQYGGGLSTQEVTAPGFYHNLHSINHFHISETPWFKDLGLEDRVIYITPRYEFGQAHRDGTALVFGRDREETIANVARFSKKDAETFRDWNRRAEEITAQILIPERYAEPLPQAEREALLGRTAIGRDFLTISRRQPLDVVRELFENDHVKLLFLFKVSLFGTWLTDTLSKTSPMGSVIRAFDLETGYWRRRNVCAASSDRPYPDRRRPRPRHCASRRQDRASAAICGQHHRRASDLREPDRALATAGTIRGKTRPFPVYRLDAVRAAPRLARASQIRRRRFRPEHQPHAEMEHRRRDDGGFVHRLRGRQSEPRAAHRAVRLRAVECHRIRRRPRPASTRPIAGM